MFLIIIGPNLTIEMAIQQSDRTDFMQNQDECATTHAQSR